VEPLRLGVLGAARIAGTAIVEPARLTGARLVAVAARDLDRASTFAAAHGVEQVYGSYAEVLADPQVEAIYNPLANSLHGPWNLAAVEAGKHVLTEKPSASNAAEAHAVRDAVAGAGVLFMEGFHYLYHPVARRLLEIAGSGEIGELRSVEISMRMPPPADGDPRWSLELAGGSLMDVGCYGLHMHRALGAFAGGEPVVTAARGGERDPGVDEWLDVELAFPNGVTGLVRSAMNHEEFDFSCRLIGSAGEAFGPSYVLPHLDDRVLITVDGTTTEQELGRRSSYVYQLEAFANAVRGGDPVLTGPDDAVASAELIDAAYLAAGFEPRPNTSL
jgi:predicted dehydrogenase